jgi:hypothetical protein
LSTLTHLDLIGMPMHRRFRGRGGIVMTSRVQVDPAIFEMQGDRAYRRFVGDGESTGGWEIEPYFLVRSSDPGRAAEALTAARERFTHITAQGEEVDDLEAACAAGVYTPSLVRGPFAVEGDPCLRVNTDGNLWAPMGQTMLAVLIEELERLDIDAVVRRPMVPRCRCRHGRTPTHAADRSWR